MALTDLQIATLDERVDEFLAADYDLRERIARDSLRSFKYACPQGVKFDDMSVETVRAPSAALGCSHMFLAHSPAPLWKNKTGNREVCSQDPKPAG